MVLDPTIDGFVEPGGCLPGGRIRDAPRAHQAEKGELAVAGSYGSNRGSACPGSRYWAPARRAAEAQAATPFARPRSWLTRLNSTPPAPPTDETGGVGRLTGGPAPLGAATARARPGWAAAERPEVGRWRVVNQPARSLRRQPRLQEGDVGGCNPADRLPNRVG